MFWLICNAKPFRYLLRTRTDRFVTRLKSNIFFRFSLARRLALVRLSSRSTLHRSNIPWTRQRTPSSRRASTNWVKPMQTCLSRASPSSTTTRGTTHPAASRWSRTNIAQKLSNSRTPSTTWPCRTRSTWTLWRTTRRRWTVRIPRPATTLSSQNVVWNKIPQLPPPHKNEKPCHVVT